MNCMLTTANINCRSIGVNSANFSSSARSVNRFSEENYSQQDVYIPYTFSAILTSAGLILDEMAVLPMRLLNKMSSILVSIAGKRIAVDCFNYQWRPK